MRLHTAHRRVRSNLRGLMLLLLLIATVSAYAAPRRQPPSKLLASSLYTVVCAFPSAAESTDSLHLRVESVLRGEPRTAATIRVPAGVAEFLDPAQAYLFVFGDLQRDTRKGNSYQRVNVGTIASTEGAEPAIFGDCERAATWLNADAPERRAQILAGTQSVDPVEQDFMLAELLLRPEFYSTLSTAETAQVFAIAAHSQALPAARLRVIQAALDNVLNVADTRQQAVWLAVVTQSPVTTPSTDLHNPESLIYLSLQQLQSQADGLDLASIARWLSSPRPAVAEQAALVLRAIDPALERPAITDALQQTYMPTPTRVFLHDHLRRLQLIADKAQQ